MKKLILTALAAASISLAGAQQAYTEPSFGDNWSIGVDGGVTTPLNSGYSFFGDMRPTVGVHIQKLLSPSFSIGAEGFLGVNTSSWYEYRQSTAFDNSYLGVFVNVNLFNLIGGYKCEPRFFDIEATGGIGWGHDYANDGPNDDLDKDYNYIAAKVGLNFNFNVCPNFTVSLKPAAYFNRVDQDYAGAHFADFEHSIENRTFTTFNCQVGLTYNFGPGFRCADTKNQAEIDALNATLNGLRAELDACLATGAVNAANVAALQAELDACRNRAPQVVERVSDNLQSVRYIFYAVGSSVITRDQQPNVEMVASYLKNHKDAKVVVKGYASPEGNREFNIKLAQARAVSVKAMLVEKYGIAADRITAEGEGIGDMFSENDWNRVSICTIEE